MISDLDKYHYITAYASLFGVKEEKVAQYAQEHGLHSLTTPNASLLTGAKQLAKLDAFNRLRDAATSLKRPSHMLDGVTEALHYICDRLHQENIPERTYIAIFLNARLQVTGDHLFQLNQNQLYGPGTRAILREAVKNNAPNLIGALVSHDRSLGSNRAVINRYKTAVSNLREDAKQMGINLCDSFIDNYSIYRDEIVPWPISATELRDGEQAPSLTYPSTTFAKAYALIAGIDETKITEYLKNKATITLLQNPHELLRGNRQVEKHNQLIRLMNLMALAEQQKATINSPNEAANYFRALAEDIHHQETLSVLYLDDDNQVLAYKAISKGGISSAVIQPRDIFRYAFECNATQIILGHNHPSGDVAPSEADIRSFEAIRASGNVLGLKVIDSVIVSGVSELEIYSIARDHVARGHWPYKTTIENSDLER